MRKATECIKDDWVCMLPYRVSRCGYRGINRQSYALICFMYYAMKSLFILFLTLIFYIGKYTLAMFKFVFWNGIKRILKLEEKEWYMDRFSQVEEEQEECEQCENGTAYEDDLEELPFSQLFTVGADMCLLVHHVEMCPDETAYIRVVDEEGYTPLYKRKVKRSKQGDRYIVFNGTNYYLDEEKTQPIIKKK